jgi:ABC-type amino acid transport substrate-binding protein
VNHHNRHLPPTAAPHQASATGTLTDTPRRQLLGAALGGLLGLTLPGGSALAQAGGTALERIRQRGRLVVGVYQDLPPFHAGGKGIEVELAGALAQALGLQLTLLPFLAGEDMNDDLRNVVWKGHYLGWGPADVMLHVPVDRVLMQANPRVSIFSPYWRERVMIARDLAKVPVLDSLEPLRGKPVAAAGQSLAGWLMLGADDGAYRNTLRTQLSQGVEAAELLKKGEVVAACGLDSELQSVLGQDARYAITPLPMPRAPRDGWVVGMAVKNDAVDLAQALRDAMEQLATSGRLKTLFAAGALNWQRF